MGNMPSRMVVASVINPLTLLPRNDAERHYIDAFYQEINALRSRFVSVAAMGFAVPLLVAGGLVKNSKMKAAAFGCAAVLLLAGVLMLFPAVRGYLLKGRKGDAVTSALVLCGYAFIALQALLPMELNEEDGGLRATRRMVFSTLMLIAGMVVHTHVLVLGFCHLFLLAGTVIIAMRVEDRDATGLWTTLASFLTVQTTLFVVLYDLSRMRCSELIQREMIIGEKSKASANKLNRDFICQVLHDLGTPLSAIMLGLSNLSDHLEKSLDTEDHDIMTEMQLACTHINSLRDRAIKFAKFSIEEKDMVPVANLAPVDIRKVVQAQIRPLAKSIGRNNNVDFRCTVHPDVPAVFDTDEEWVVDILLNLLSNAVKFTTEGWVALNIDLETDRSPDHDFVRFEVMDTGIGISDEDKANLFNPLVQSDEVAEAARGAGLGLWSVRMKVKALGGHYKVTDNYPKGAIFSVSVPATHSSEQSATSPSTPEQRPQSSPLFGFTVRGDRVEHDCDCAIERTPTATRLGGVSVVRLSPPRVVGTAKSSQREEATLEAIERQPATKVLIIDDQSVIRRMLRRGLEKHGIDVDEAVNGVEGLEKMKAEVYDCVISDITMPGLGGLDMIREYRHWEATQPPRRRQLVYALSGTCLEQSRQEALDAGMDDFYSKPLDIDSVVARIRGR